MKNILFLFLIGITTTAFIIPEKILKKADKVITKFYETENFTKEFIEISSKIDSETPSDFSNKNLFKISSEEKLLGYGYIGSANSKTAEFDYLVLFDVNLIISKSKVLVYREEYGGEIGSKRWLKQFIGKSAASEELIYGENIVPISGATISVRSMTQGINDLLKSIGILQKQDIL